MNALIVYGSNYNVAVYCSIKGNKKKGKSEFYEVSYVKSKSN